MEIIKGITEVLFLASMVQIVLLLTLIWRESKRGEQLQSIENRSGCSSWIYNNDIERYEDLSKVHCVALVGSGIELIVMSLFHQYIIYLIEIG